MTKSFTVDIGDIELAVLEWPGDSDPVLLLHATGFHSRCWNQVVNHLPDQRVLAVDLRFHGASGAAGQVDWRLLAHDIRLLVEQLDLQRLVGVGHSIGGHLITRVAAAMGERFKQLVLVDPVIMSPDHYDRMHDFVDTIHAQDHPVARRKNHWRDAGEMYERFHAKAPFNRWLPEVLRDYCDYALLPADDEGVRRLACDPINEASVYLRQTGTEVIFDELPVLDIPVTLLRAPPGERGVADLSTSPTWPGLAAALPLCREIYLPDMSHFIPMEDPQLVARYIREAQADQWHREPGTQA